MGSLLFAAVAAGVGFMLGLAVRRRLPAVPPTDDLEDRLEATMRSALGNGRPQDWPREMYALAQAIKRRIRDGRPVVLSRQMAHDAVVGLNVGGDALAERYRREDPNKDGEG